MWEMVAAIAAVATLLVTIFVGVFLGGKLAQQVKDHGEALDAHGVKIEALGVRVGDHDVSIGRLHEWKNGFNAGARSSAGAKE